MLSNQLILVGTLVDVEGPDSTLIHTGDTEKEIHEYFFSITDESGLRLPAEANSANGTAFYALKHDPLFREGHTCRATGYLANLHGHTVFCVQELQRGTSHANLVIDPLSLTLEQLKDKAQDNLYMGKAALFKLLDSFSVGTPQHYVLALQIRRQHHDKSEDTAVAEKDAVCENCKTQLYINLRYAYRFGKAHCQTCERNVAFDLVDPIPRETKEPLSFDEIQARLKQRFGNNDED